MDAEIEDGLAEYRAESARPATHRIPGRGRWVAAIRAWCADPRAVRIPPVAPPAGAPRWWLSMVAEAAMEASEGCPRQGWDSEGHYGLGGLDVARLWSARADRWMVRQAVLHRRDRPGAALPRGRRSIVARTRDEWRAAKLPDQMAIDGLRRVGISHRARLVAARLGDAVLAALVLRRSAERLPAERHTLLARDIDWRGCRPIIDAWVRVDEERRQRLRWAAATMVEWGHVADRLRAYAPEVLQPAGWARGLERLEARLILGESPRDLAPGLTRKEAARWLAYCRRIRGVLSPGRWLCNSASSDMSRLGDVDLYGVRSVEVARWLIACARDDQRRAALQRPLRLPPVGGGAPVEIVPLRAIDEIEPEDLVRGPRTGVEAAFRAARERMTQAQIDAWKDRHARLAPPPAWWRPGVARCARLLDSPAALAIEGEEMRHCVGGYVETVRHRNSAVVALNVVGHRSTVELDYRTGAVVQHRGRSNADPPKLCTKALKVVLRRLGV